MDHSESPLSSPSAEGSGCRLRLSMIASHLAVSQKPAWLSPRRMLASSTASAVAYSESGRLLVDARKSSFLPVPLVDRESPGWHISKRQAPPTDRPAPIADRAIR